MKNILSFLSRVKEAWSFLLFFIYLAFAYFAKWRLSLLGYELPVFAPWEMAALVHVFHFAWDMMDFKGYMYVSKRFNALTKKLILVITGLILFTKAMIIFVETHEFNQAEKSSHALIEFYGSAKPLEAYVHFLSTYIMIFPLIMFLFFNSLALWKVQSESASLGLEDTDEEKFLTKMIAHVDIPPIGGFAVVFGFFIWDNGIGNNPTMIGITVCLTLTISNILAAFHVKRADEA